MILGVAMPGLVLNHCSLCYYKSRIIIMLLKTSKVIVFNVEHPEIFRSKYWNIILLNLKGNHLQQSVCCFWQPVKTVDLFLGIYFRVTLKLYLSSWLEWTKKKEQGDNRTRSCEDRTKKQHMSNFFLHYSLSSVQIANSFSPRYLYFQIFF